MTAPVPPARPSLRRSLLKLHRWLSLGAAIFWLLQAITGVLIVFHWEITDAGIPGAHRPTDLAAIERRIAAIAPRDSGVTVKSVWTAAGYADRYNIIVEDAEGNGLTVRVAGDGTQLRNTRDGETTLMGFLVGFHHDLLGAWGSWIVSISGILLCTNLILGLVAAWPRRGTWRLALRPATRGPAAARLYSWHRALGLWVAAPALIIAATGTLLKFEGGVGDLAGVTPVALPPNPPAGDPIGFAAAARAGLAAIPGSTLTQAAWPKPDDATWRIRVRAPGELRRAYGGSYVLVDANSGAVRGIFPAAQAAPANAFMSALFPIHTGEAGGLPGRILSIAIGLWLITMIVAGSLLWFRRRKPRKPA
ncbi:PepSY domain-containing protein [Sphingomonas sp. BT-65]|uniref:PepSY-associated TM helix domain-containing protein n=1 Tax=Sphingomonas sp. BT-65 TaxID=2989821 RepID=UPI00223567C6|nr:PepSY-associated TM helix domain-containing protein [Sphingomonas sp. BT-65]MCW4460711.1 PepSY domain-containing protein [Sphingomonas sp. BT-65]